jgi:hypothetical protein
MNAVHGAGTAVLVFVLTLSLNVGLSAGRSMDRAALPECRFGIDDGPCRFDVIRHCA